MYEMIYSAEFTIFRSIRQNTPEPQDSEVLWEEEKMKKQIYSHISNMDHGDEQLGSYPLRFNYTKYKPKLQWTNCVWICTKWLLFEKEMKKHQSLQGLIHQAP